MSLGHNQINIIVDGATPTTYVNQVNDDGSFVTDTETARVYNAKEAGRALRTLRQFNEGTTFDIITLD